MIGRHVQNKISFSSTISMTLRIFFPKYNIYNIYFPIWNITEHVSNTGRITYKTSPDPEIVCRCFILYFNVFAEFVHGTTATNAVTVLIIQEISSLLWLGRWKNAVLGVVYAFTSCKVKSRNYPTCARPSTILLLLFVQTEQHIEACFQNYITNIVRLDDFFWKFTFYIQFIVQYRKRIILYVYH